MHFNNLLCVLYTKVSYILHIKECVCVLKCVHIVLKCAYVVLKCVYIVLKCVYIVLNCVCKL